MSDPPVADAAARVRALDPQRSFIVQAPAGSGKTGLLIQRMLALLATCEAPEEIVAITFTRKAAAEMRDRVVEALERAADDAPPAEEHARRTWTLARAARQRDVELGWGIESNPGRLRIQTIDALCASLTRQMPVLSGFGVPPETLEDAQPLYVEGARRTLGMLDGGGAAALAVARLLRHLDNDVGTAEGLLAGMLARRDQWLRHVADPHSPRLERPVLEQGLHDATVDALSHLAALVPSDLALELIPLARYAAGNLVEAGKDSPVCALLDLEALPDPVPEALATWCGLAALLLTNDGDVRKRVDVNTGFPSSQDKADKATRAAWKDRMAAALSALAEHPEFVAELGRTRRLPPPHYDESQWELVEALVAVLPLAVAQLDLLFRERRQVDFTAVAQAAVRALGQADAPTDLALALDYRIRHLLVDEFQDTSQSQYELLSRLTAGWEPDDGRTLFVVGDPMQSIYRFREADVALYLRARMEGIGSVALEPLALGVNFRSDAGIVRWVNDTFARLLPEAEDLASGAVRYSSSEAVHPASEGAAVVVHPAAGRDRAAEAEQVVSLVRRVRDEKPDQSVAILVRSRSRLSHIVPALKAAGLGFQAIDIDLLADRPMVQDLHALTRALVHPADRVAWLAVLRAPWCGLSLADLEAVAGFDAQVCVFDALQRFHVIERLSPAGRTRAAHVVTCLQRFVDQRGRGTLRRRVEGAWLALGGPATAIEGSDLADAATYLATLDELESGGDLADFAELDVAVGQLYARPDPAADERLQIMTIHKAKGLEFDTVILPGLGYAPRESDKPLLRWMERPRAHGDSDLLLAPIRARSREEDPIYDYLEQLDKAKGEHEDGRLLYVAATRARKRLHLIGHANVRNGRATPARRSLLERLWPAVREDFEGLVETSDADGKPSDAEPVQPGNVLRRLTAGWSPPPLAASVIAPRPAEATASGSSDVEFSWASETARHVGTVVHRALQRIADDGLETWSAVNTAARRATHERDLRKLGVPEAELEGALARVTAALTAAVADARARWLFAPHVEAHTELRLTGVVGNDLIDVAIDRTFVDSGGVRWIVDYKTGVHEGADPEGFLDNERERYRAQLERYAVLMARLDARPVRLALYFPLMRGWREWEPGARAAPS
ncbi:MAG: UvrD-helicase domain-containing protein [Burkholderiales bacterium]|nr:UvrD-helicase domain-containing protein [Burkholderiales bacterium]